MKIQKINESVDWEKSMEGNNENIDRLSRLRTQVNIDPVMEEVIDETEKANKNAKDVYTKLAKGAKSITPKDPGTGKKVTIKPYTEKLALDEGMFPLNEYENHSGETEREAVQAFKSALLRFRKGVIDFTEAIYDFDSVADVNKIIVDDFPFDVSFDEVPITEWLETCIENCDKILNGEKTESLEEDYGDYPIATMGLTNTSGIGIYDINDEEVTYAFIDGGEKEPVKETAIIEYECEDEDSDCRPYFSVGDTKYYLDDFIRTSFEDESLTEKKTINEYASEDEKDDFNTVLDFVDARLFGTNKQGSKPNSTNYKKTYNFLTDINVPIKGGKGRYDYALFYPDNMAYMSGAEVIGRLSRRYPMFDDGIGVYLIDEDEAVLAKAVADELNFNYKIEPIKSDKGFNYVIKIFIPESVMEMPIDKYLESIGKSLSQYKNATKKRGKKSKSEIEGA